LSKKHLARLLMKEAVRRLESPARLLYRWRQLMMVSHKDDQPMFVPVTISIELGMTDSSALALPSAIVGSA
jgi:hypothetical protein